VRGPPAPSIGETQRKQSKKLKKKRSQTIEHPPWDPQYVIR